MFLSENIVKIALTVQYYFTHFYLFFYSSTFTLGAQDHFNNMLDVKGSKFTYLVPSNEAWENIQGEMASTWKVLFNGDFGYQVKYAIFQRIDLRILSCCQFE